MNSRPMTRTAMLVLMLGLLGSCNKPPQAPPVLAAAQVSPTHAPLPQSQMPVTAEEQARILAAQVASGANQPKKTIKVGLLLPLSGRNATIGRALQDAATLSLFDKYARLPINMQGVRVELLPKDTGDSPEFARNAAAAAIADGAQLLIGPVFADATQIAASVAAAKNIPVLSFSNNRSRAVPGIYLLGFSPQDQAQRVVAYALQHDKKRIAVLVPRSPLGDEVIAGAKAASVAAGIALAAEVQYTPQAIGLQDAITKLIPNNGEGANFDALLLAEGGPTLETLLRALAARGVTQASVQLLGTGIWDDVNLLRQVNLDHAWFASSAPDATAQFDGRFRSTYNYNPPRIASLSYDAVALAVALATSERPYTPDNLTTKAGFMGPANGIFRLRSGDTAERGLAVIQVEGGGLRVISPAPTGFSAN